MASIKHTVNSDHPYLNPKSQGWILEQMKKGVICECCDTKVTVPLATTVDLWVSKMNGRVKQWISYQCPSCDEWVELAEFTGTTSNRWVRED